MKHKKGHAPIKNEATNGLKNKRGTLAMARTNDINSATAQFFVNLVDNEFLDNKPGNYGYAVFGAHRFGNGSRGCDRGRQDRQQGSLPGRADRDRGHRVGTPGGRGEVSGRADQRNSIETLTMS